MQTIVHAFFEHAALRPADPCWQYKDAKGWQTVSWAGAAAGVNNAARWLIEKGLNPGDSVAIWSSTRFEWTVWDLAIMSAGGVTVPVYNNLPAQQASFIIDEPGCKFLILEREFQPGLLREVKQLCPHLQETVLIEGGMVDCKGADTTVRERVGALTGQTLATIVYTSGTTGNPKGVELTHDNFAAEVDGLREVLPFPRHYIGLMFLPLAHIVARAMQMFQITQGCVAAYAESMDKVAQNLLEVRPHFFAGVPRLYEKIYRRVQEQLKSAPGLKRRFFNWAIDVGGRFGQSMRHHQSASLGLRLKNTLAKRAFAPLKKKMGGRLVCCISGGAPLDKELGKFFHAAGILIIEGYGLTETTAAVAINRLDDFRFGSVGKPVSTVQVRLAGDGEILVKGRTVTRGYFRRPEENHALFDQQGWLCTGDIGGFSRDGFLRITDRKKDLIKTSGGKYIAPQPIEAMLKQNALINDVVVYGDRQKYLTALLTLNRDSISRWAQGEGIQNGKWEDLCRNDRVREMVQQIVDEANRKFASFETVKKFTILADDFTIEGGQLTPTMKVKRKAAYERYKNLFEEMYKE